LTSFINPCIDLVAPLKTFNERPIEIGPWVDEQLLEKKIVRDYYYFKFQNSNTSLDTSEYFPKYKQYKAFKFNVSILNSSYWLMTVYIKI
jgi:hypothetical protein